MALPDHTNYYLDQFFERLGDDMATQAWRNALEASITNNSGNWVSWGSLFDLWKVTVEGSDGFVDPQDYLKNSDLLKKLVGKYPKPEPPDRDRPDPHGSTLQRAW